MALRVVLWFGEGWGKSEWVAYGKMECEGILEFGHVVVATLAGVIRGVYAYTKVAAHHEHADVHT